MKLNLAELRLIWFALETIDEEGCYYGRFDQFRKRLEDVMTKVELEIKQKGSLR